MASTVKIPIAITLLLKVDHNKERLNRLISFNQNDSVPGSGTAYMITILVNIRELKLCLCGSYWNLC